LEILFNNMIKTLAEKLLENIRKSKVRRIAILTHPNADPDAIGSAVATKYFLEHSLDNVSVKIFSSSLSALSKKMVEDFNVDISLDLEELLEFDCAILVDMNDIKASYPDVNVKVFAIIDHHQIPMYVIKNTDAILIHELSPSTCEIVYKMLKKFKIDPPKEIYFMLLIGILFDTKQLSLASCETLKIVAEITEKGINYRDAINYLRHVPDISERMAKLKALTRSKIKRVGDYIIVFTHVSSFHGLISSMLVSLGADVAITGGVTDGNKIVISARSTRSFYESTGISLAELMSEIGKLIGGAGGGHPTAAGANGYGNKSDLMEILKVSVRMIEERIKSR